MCIKYFGEEDVICNIPFFIDKNNNLWDADIIIKSIKTAVGYNGIWHYKKVRRNHNLSQVQTRDIIKQSVIKANGYDYYIIKDMGKYKQEFVEEQFWLFLHKIIFRKVLAELSSK